MNRFNKLLILMFLTFPLSGQSKDLLKIESNFVILGTIVKSTCDIRIEADNSLNSVIDFGVVKVNSNDLVAEKYFTLSFYENGSELKGCSSIQYFADQLVVHFGNEQLQQLDHEGVVTTGAGDGIRVLVRATDQGYASYMGDININNSEIIYPSSFASHGEFSYAARLSNLEDAKSGEFSGNLSITMEYQ